MNLPDVRATVRLTPPSKAVCAPDPTGVMHDDDTTQMLLFAGHPRAET
jgi:hypothetical protein